MECMEWVLGGYTYAHSCMHMDGVIVESCPMTHREECRVTYIGVSESTRREE